MAQHAAQQPWDRTGEEKAAYLRRMFGDISSTYDLLNSAMTLRGHHRWRRDAVRMLAIKPGDTVADVCCGTGDFGGPLSRAGAKVVGIDFCQPMLALAAKKPFNQKLSLGDATRLPLKSESVNAVTVGWGLRNVPDLQKALSEIHRILKPGGRFVSVDMALPKSAFMRALVKNTIPIFGKIFGKSEAYTYLPDSTEKFATREELAQ